MVARELCASAGNVGRVRRCLAAMDGSADRGGARGGAEQGWWWSGAVMSSYCGSSAAGVVSMGLSRVAQA